MEWTRDGFLTPVSSVEDDTFARICPSSPEAANEDVLAAALFPQAPAADPMIGRYAAAYVGHAAEDSFRAAGSSGGMVSWVAAELLRRGLVDGVAHVAPMEQGPLFAYRLSRTEGELRDGAKSRYHPVEMSAVLREIAAVPGRYAVVGLPCFVKAVNLLRREEPVFAERIVFTLGLFCGHMKSARMVDSFAWQLGADRDELKAIEYRLKDPDRPANWYVAQLALKDGSTRRQDWLHLVDGDWGSGFFMNPACNFCDDVVAETADISFGDAWLEPYSSDGRGTNVVVVRSPAMEELIAGGMEIGRLALEPVDDDFVRRTQAAGLRQRREGLAYRLARTGKPIRKRVEPRPDIAGRRKLIYRMRQGISRWSLRMFHLAEVLQWRGLYIAWGRAARASYHELAYPSSGFGRLIERVIDPARKARD